MAVAMRPLTGSQFRETSAKIRASYIMAKKLTLHRSLNWRRHFRSASKHSTRISMIEPIKSVPQRQPMM